MLLRNKKGAGRGGVWMLMITGILIKYNVYIINFKPISLLYIYLIF